MNRIGFGMLAFVLFMSIGVSCQNFFWSHRCCDDQEGCVEYGLLYNWWAAIGDTDGDDVAETSIAAEGFHTPTKTELDVLRDYVGGNSVAGGELKQTGTSTWNPPNTGAVDTYNFTLPGASYRDGATGAFGNVGNKCYLIGLYSNYAYTTGLDFGNTRKSTYDLLVSASWKPYGMTIRLLKDSPTEAELLLNDGEYADPYVGNDGQTYLTVKIGNQVWLAENLMETEYRDGTDIPIVEDQTTWANLTTGAMCAYENTYTNVGCDFTP